MQKLRGGAVPTVTSGALDLPADSDIEFFQCAPADQRIGYLTGGEWILLEGMNATRKATLTELPPIRIACRLLAESGTSHPIALDCDTVFVDGEALIATLVFRGAVDRSVAGGDRIGLASRLGADTGEGWPALDAPPRSRSIEEKRVPAANDAKETADLSDAAQELAAEAQLGAPFAVAPSAPPASYGATSSRERSGTPWSHASPPQVTPAKYAVDETFQTGARQPLRSSVIALLASALRKSGLSDATVEHAILERERAGDT
jgi:hypothetical protein